MMQCFGSGMEGTTRRDEECRVVVEEEEEQKKEDEEVGEMVRMGRTSRSDSTTKSNAPAFVTITSNSTPT